MSRPAADRCGKVDRAFLAFRLHRFISDAGFVCAILRGAGERRVTLEEQRFDPDDPDSRLYPAFSCPNVWAGFQPDFLVDKDGTRQVLPRAIDETPIEDEMRREQTTLDPPGLLASGGPAFTRMLYGRMARSTLRACSGGRTSYGLNWPIP